MILQSAMPRCLRLRPKTEDQYEAIQRLVRPDEVSFIAWWLMLQATRIGISFAQVVADWIAGFTYIKDPNLFGYDQWCSPAETLRRNGGDCDDLSILVVSALLSRETFATVAVGNVWKDRAWRAHAWVEGYDDHGWFLIEATSGEIHRQFRPAIYAPEVFLGPGYCERVTPE